ncbi:MAG: DUF1232 domain-containing protein [Aquificae bacterium]|nr:DUF1232 domain-containing protein [Aquificota bacterium]
MEERLAPFRERPQDAEQLRKAVMEKLTKVPPTMEHVRDLVMNVRLMLRMLTDVEFTLKEEARADFFAALWYFIEEKDRLSDKLPIFGFKDDYEVVEYVLNKHRSEVERYLSSTRPYLAYWL